MTYAFIESQSVRGPINRSFVCEENLYGIDNINSRHRVGQQFISRGHDRCGKLC